MIHLSKRHGDHRYAAELVKRAVYLIWWKIPVNDIDAMRVVALRKVPPCIKREIYQARFRTNDAIRKML
jgi:hypothetical protein